MSGRSYNVVNSAQIKAVSQQIKNLGTELRSVRETVEKFNQLTVPTITVKISVDQNTKKMAKEITTVANTAVAEAEGKVSKLSIQIGKIMVSVQAIQALEKEISNAVKKSPISLTFKVDTASLASSIESSLKKIKAVAIPVNAVVQSVQFTGGAGDKSATEKFVLKGALVEFDEKKITASLNKTFASLRESMQKGTVKTQFSIPVVISKLNISESARRAIAEEVQKIAGAGLQVSVVPNEKSLKESLAKSLSGLPLNFSDATVKVEAEVSRVKMGRNDEKPKIKAQIDREFLFSDITAAMNEAAGAIQERLSKVGFALNVKKVVISKETLESLAQELKNKVDASGVPIELAVSAKALRDSIISSLAQIRGLKVNVRAVVDELQTPANINLNPQTAAAVSSGAVAAAQASEIVHAIDAQDSGPAKRKRETERIQRDTNNALRQLIKSYSETEEGLSEFGDELEEIIDSLRYADNVASKGRANIAKAVPRLEETRGGDSSLRRAGAFRASADAMHADGAAKAAEKTLQQVQKAIVAMGGAIDGDLKVKLDRAYAGALTQVVKLRAETERLRDTSKQIFNLGSEDGLPRSIQNAKELQATVTKIKEESEEFQKAIAKAAGSGASPEGLSGMKSVFDKSTVEDSARSVVEDLTKQGSRLDKDIATANMRGDTRLADMLKKNRAAVESEIDKIRKSFVGLGEEWTNAVRTIDRTKMSPVERQVADVQEFNSKQSYDSIGKGALGGDAEAIQQATQIRNEWKEREKLIKKFIRQQEKSKSLTSKEVDQLRELRIQTEKTNRQVEKIDNARAFGEASRKAKENYGAAVGLSSGLGQSMDQYRDAQESGQDTSKISAKINSQQKALQKLNSEMQKHLTEMEKIAAKTPSKIATESVENISIITQKIASETESMREKVKAFRRDMSKEFGALGSDTTAYGVKRFYDADSIKHNIDLADSLKGSVGADADSIVKTMKVGVRKQDIDSWHRIEQGVKAYEQVLKQLGNSLNIHTRIAKQDNAEGAKSREILKDLKVQIDRVTEGYRELTAKTGAATEKMRHQKKINETLAGGFDAIGVSLGRAIINNTVFASSFAVIFGVTSAIRQAVTDFIQLEKEMTRVLIVSEAVSMTNKELGAVIGETLVAASKKFGVSYSDGSKILREFGSAGIAAEVALRAFDSTLKTVIASESDAGEVTRTVSAIYSVMADSIDNVGGSLQRINHINDVMTRAFMDSQLELQELTQGFRFASASARNVGVGFEELTSLLAVLNNNFIKSGQAGRSLQTSFSQIAQKGPAFAKAFNIEYDPRKPLDFMDLLEGVGNQMRSTALQASEVEDIFKIFGLEGARSFIVLSQNFEAVREQLENIKEASRDSVDVAASLHVDTLDVKLNALFRTMQTGFSEYIAFLAGGEDGWKVIGDEIDRVTKAAEWFFKMITSGNREDAGFFEKMASKIAKGTAVVIGLSIAYGIARVAISAWNAVIMQSFLLKTAWIRSTILKLQVTKADSAATAVNTAATLTFAKAQQVAAAGLTLVWNAAVRLMSVLAPLALMAAAMMAMGWAFDKISGASQKSGDATQKSMETLKQERQEILQNIRAYNNVERELTKVIALRNSSASIEDIGAAARKIVDQHADSIRAMGNAQAMTNRQLAENVELLREQIRQQKLADQVMLARNRDESKVSALEGTRDLSSADLRGGGGLFGRGAPTSITDIMENIEELGFVDLAAFVVARGDELEGANLSKVMQALGEAYQEFVVQFETLAEGQAAFKEILVQNQDKIGLGDMASEEFMKTFFGGDEQAVTFDVQLNFEQANKELLELTRKTRQRNSWNQLGVGRNLISQLGGGTAVSLEEIAKLEESARKNLQRAESWRVPETDTSRKDREAYIEDLKEILELTEQYRRAQRGIQGGEGSSRQIFGQALGSMNASRDFESTTIRTRRPSARIATSFGFKDEISVNQQVFQDAIRMFDRNEEEYGDMIDRFDSRFRRTNEFMSGMLAKMNAQGDLTRTYQLLTDMQNVDTSISDVSERVAAAMDKNREEVERSQKTIFEDLMTRSGGLLDSEPFVDMFVARVPEAMQANIKEAISDRDLKGISGALRVEIDKYLKDLTGSGMEATLTTYIELDPNIVMNIAELQDSNFTLQSGAEGTQVINALKDYRETMESNFEVGTLLQEFSIKDDIVALGKVFDGLTEDLHAIIKTEEGRLTGTDTTITVAEKLMGEAVQGVSAESVGERIRGAVIAFGNHVDRIAPEAASAFQQSISEMGGMETLGTNTQFSGMLDKFAKNLREVGMEEGEINALLIDAVSVATATASRGAGQTNLQTEQNALNIRDTLAQSSLDAADRMIPALELLRESMIELNTSLNQKDVLREQRRQLINERDRLNATYGEDPVAAAKELGDRIHRLNAVKDMLNVMTAEAAEVMENALRSGSREEAEAAATSFADNQQRVASMEAQVVEMAQQRRMLEQSITMNAKNMYNIISGLFRGFVAAITEVRVKALEHLSAELGAQQAIADIRTKMISVIEEVASNDGDTLDLEQKLVELYNEQYNLIQKINEAKRKRLGDEENELKNLLSAQMGSIEGVDTIFSMRSSMIEIEEYAAELNAIQNISNSYSETSNRNLQKESELRAKIASSMNEFFKGLNQILKVEEQITNSLDKRLEIVRQMSSLYESEISRLGNNVTAGLETSISRGARRFARSLSSMFSSDGFIPENVIERIVSLSKDMSGTFESTNKHLNDMVRRMATMQEAQRKNEVAQIRLMTQRLALQKRILELAMRSGNIQMAEQSIGTIQQTATQLGELSPMMAAGVLGDLSATLDRLGEMRQAQGAPDLGGLMNLLGMSLDKLTEISSKYMEYNERRVTEFVEQGAILTEDVAEKAAEISRSSTDALARFVEIVDLINTDLRSAIGMFIEGLAYATGNATGMYQGEIEDLMGRLARSRDTDAAAGGMVNIAEQGFSGINNGMKLDRSTRSGELTENVLERTAVTTEAAVREGVIQGVGSPAVVQAVQAANAGAPEVIATMREVGDIVSRASSMMSTINSSGRASGGTELDEATRRLTSERTRVSGSSRMAGLEGMGALTDAMMEERRRMQADQIIADFWSRDAERVIDRFATELADKANDFTRNLGQRLKAGVSMFFMEDIRSSIGTAINGVTQVLDDVLFSWMDIFEQVGAKNDELTDAMGGEDQLAELQKRLRRNQMTYYEYLNAIEDIQLEVQNTTNDIESPDIAGQLLSGIGESFGSSATEMFGNFRKVVEDTATTELSEGLLSRLVLGQGLSQSARAHIKDELTQVFAELEGIGFAGMSEELIDSQVGRTRRRGRMNVDFSTVIDYAADQSGFEAENGKVVRALSALTDATSGASRSVENLSSGALQQEATSFGRTMGEFSRTVSETSAAISRAANGLGDGAAVSAGRAAAEIQRESQNFKRVVSSRQELQQGISASGRRAMSAVVGQGTGINFDTSTQEEFIQNAQMKIAIMEAIGEWDSTTRNVIGIYADEADSDVQKRKSLLDGDFKARRREKKGEDRVRENFAKAIAGAGRMVLAAGTMMASNVLKLSSIDFSEVADHFLEVLETLPDKISDIIDQVVERIPDIVNAIGEALPGVVEAIFSRMPEMVNAIVGQMATLIPTMMEQIPTVITGLLGGVTAVIDNFSTILKNVLEGIAGLLPKLIPALLESVGEIAGSLIAAIPSIVTEIIKQIPSIIAGLLKGILNGIAGVFKGIWNGIKKLFGGGKKNKTREEMVQEALAQVEAFDYNTIQLPKFHTGGMVRTTHKAFEANGLASDEVPAVLLAGEAVLNRQAVQLLGGASKVRALNGGAPIYTALADRADDADIMKRVARWRHANDTPGALLNGVIGRKNSGIEHLMYHEGGIIQKNLVEGLEELERVGADLSEFQLLPNEVPVVLKAGEGVLTLQGLANLGGAPVLNALNMGEDPANQRVVKQMMLFAKAGAVQYNNIDWNNTRGGLFANLARDIKNTGKLDRAIGLKPYAETMLDALAHGKNINVSWRNKGGDMVAMDQSALADMNPDQVKAVKGLGKNFTKQILSRAGQQIAQARGIGRATSGLKKYHTGGIVGQSSHMPTFDWSDHSRDMAIMTPFEIPESSFVGHSGSHNSGAYQNQQSSHTENNIAFSPVININVNGQENAQDIAAYVRQEIEAAYRDFVNGVRLNNTEEAKYFRN